MTDEGLSLFLNFLSIFFLFVFVVVVVVVVFFFPVFCLLSQKVASFIADNLGVKVLIIERFHNFSGHYL